jgi:ABC-type dipeptide/oligopeptide/nickel transport system ATPase component
MLKHALKPRANSTPESAIEDLAGALKKDARPWHAEVPEIQNFLNEPNPETLRALLERPVTNGYQMMATYWMAAKVSTEIAGPWMAAADENYSELIKPSRSSDATALSATGIAHVATATALGSKILDRLRIELLRPGSETTLGMNDSEVRALYVDLELLDGDLHAASGSSKSYSAASYGQTLPANRDDILAALKKGQKLLFDKFPQTAQQLQDLYEQVLSSETLEIGSKSGESALSSEGAQSPSSNRYGTGLLHQPKPDGTEAWLAQAHIPSRSGVNVNLPTTFEQSTLERNQNTVNGVSGTTNMLTFMLLYMKDNGAFVTSDHEPVDLGDALMGNLTFLVMDGGHSIPEAMATSTSILANTAYIAPIDTTDGLTRAEQNAREKIRGLALEKIRQERQQVLNTYVTDYSALHEQLASPSSRDRVRQAVAEAFEKTRMTFDALHAERSSVMPAAI